MLETRIENLGEPVRFFYVVTINNPTRSILSGLATVIGLSSGAFLPGPATAWPAYLRTWPLDFTASTRHGCSGTMVRVLATMNRYTFASGVWITGCESHG